MTTMIRRNASSSSSSSSAADGIQIQKRRNDEDEDDESADDEMGLLDVSIKPKYSSQQPPSNNNNNNNNKNRLGATTTATAAAVVVGCGTTIGLLVLVALLLLHDDGDGSGGGAVRRHHGRRRRRWNTPVFLRENAVYAGSILFPLPPNYSSSVLWPTAALDVSTTEPPDFGGLDVASSTVDGVSSSTSPISITWKKQRHDDRALDWSREDLFAAFAADADEESFWGYADAVVDPSRPKSCTTCITCLYPTAIYTQLPNCNTFHEFSMLPSSSSPSPSSPSPSPPLGTGGDAGGDDELEFLGSGYYRDTWLVRQRQRQPQPGRRRTRTEDDDDTVESFVLKRTRFARDNNRNRLMKIVTEALILERMTDSPYVTGIYGHCAFSVAVETGQRDMRADLLPIAVVAATTADYQQDVNGIISQDVLDRLSVEDAHPLNNYTAPEKLDLLLQMAESLAEMHGMSTGPAVVDDIAVDQWLLALPKKSKDESDGGRKNRRVMLNDFDNAVFLAWNFTSQQYCPYRSGYMGGFKAPEQHHWSDKLTESVDVWKFGSLIFAVLTGLKPYYAEATNTEDKWALLDAGILPHWDARYGTRSFIEGRLVELMRQCYRFQPADRVDMFHVVEFLRETQQWHDANDSQP